MNDLIDIMLRRRSVRRYSEAPLGEETLRAILEAGRHAPSGGNNQAAHFLVLLQREARERLRALVAAEFAAMEEDESLYKSINHAIRSAKTGRWAFDFCAPALVVVANRRGYGNAMADSACALENMMIAAAALGVGSCWVNQLHWLDGNERVRNLLQSWGLGEEETVCGAVALGYPAEGTPLRGEPSLRHGNPVTFLR